jgi:hypothetical protein
MAQHSIRHPPARLRLVTKLPPVPAHLAETEQALFRKITSEFEINDSGAISVLTVAMEAHQRMREAREEVASEGTTFLDRFGQMRPHPAVGIERSARNDYLRAMRVLNLKIGPS